MPLTVSNKLRSSNRETGAFHSSIRYFDSSAHRFQGRNHLHAKVPTTYIQATSIYTKNTVTATSYHRRIKKTIKYQMHQSTTCCLLLALAVSVVRSATLSSNQHVTILQANQTQCLFLGKVYDDGAEVPIKSDKCNETCSCDAGTLICPGLCAPVASDFQISSYDQQNTNNQAKETTTSPTTVTITTSTKTPIVNTINTLPTALPSLEESNIDNSQTAKQQISPNQSQTISGIIKQNQSFNFFPFSLINKVPDYYIPYILNAVIIYAVMVTIAFFYSILALAKRSSKAKLPISMRLPPAYDCAKSTLAVNNELNLKFKQLQ